MSFPHSPFVCSSLEFPLLFASLLAAPASAEQGQLSAQAPTTCLLVEPLGKVDKEKINCDLLALEGQESQCLGPGQGNLLLTPTGQAPDSQAAPSFTG